MSGFLSRLIGRTRETAEVVRPRVASLFEPGQAARQAETGIESLVIDAPVETLRRRRRVVVEDEMREEAAPEVHMRSAAAPDEDAVETLQPVRPVVKPEVEQRSVPEVEPLVELSEKKPSLGVVAQRQFLEERENAKPKEVVPEVRETKPVTMRKPGEAERSVTVVREERVSAPPVERIFAPSPMPSLALPAQRPQFEAAQSLPRVAASEPVVEVTIGRIEVRAVAEAAKAQKAKADSAVMGLDEYLKTRGRGART